MAEKEHCAAALALVREALWTAWRIVSHRAMAAVPHLPVRNLVEISSSGELDHVIDVVEELLAAAARSKEVAAAIGVEPFAL